jgi:hypothetical protein
MTNPVSSEQVGSETGICHSSLIIGRLSFGEREFAPLLETIFDFSCIGM